MRGAGPDAVRGGPTQLYQYIYDADGNRIAKGSITSFSCDDTQNGFTVTNSYVLGQGGEQVTEMVIANGQASWAHTNVTVGGMLLATYDPQGLHFQLTDWLGTKRVQTNAFGQVEETCANLPFGNTLSGTPLCSSPANAPQTADDATEHHFTGKERDAESGNDYFGARYYSSSIGRFMIPDWAVKAQPVPYAKLEGPQTLNLYAYVSNNPLGGADRDGHSPYPDGFSHWLGPWAGHDIPNKPNKSYSTAQAAGNATVMGRNPFDAINNYWQSTLFLIIKSQSLQVNGDINYQVSSTDPEALKALQSGALSKGYVAEVIDSIMSNHVGLSGHPGQYTETETEYENIVSHNSFHDSVYGYYPRPLQQYFIYTLEGNNNPRDYVRIPVQIDGRLTHSETIYLNFDQSKVHIEYHPGYPQ